MIKTPLYPHQIEAVEKLSKVKVGALFMDMGTGKTLTSLKLFELKKEKGKVDKLIYLCPISAKQNLIDEVTKHTNYIYGKDYFIYGIDSISQSDRIYLEVLNLIDNKSMLVIDESTYIKNPYAKRTIRALELSAKCQYKLIMTGTPITKFVRDLWGQMYFLSPLILGYKSYYSFAKNHLEYDKHTHKIVRSCNVPYLTKKLSPYTFEKGITDITNMPPKIKLTRNYTINTKISEKYYATQEVIYEKYLYDSDNSTLVYHLFTELQKIISFDSDRIEILKETINEINPNEQVIIWVKYKKEIEMITNLLKSDYAIFDGEHKQENEFKSGKKRFLIANLQTGSHAQNFQNCHYQIFYSNNFDYATREQAERRTWRTGQQNKCIYIDIRSNAGIENIIFRCLHKKENMLFWFNKFVKDHNKEFILNYLRKELKNDTDRIEQTG